MNKKMQIIGFLSLIILLSGTYVVAIENVSPSEDQKPGLKRLSPEEVQKVKTGIMLNLLEKVQQKTETKYRVSIQIWNKEVLETLQKTEGVTVVQISGRRAIADVDGKVLEQILQDKLSGKYEGINLINLATDDTDQGQTSLLASSRSVRFSDGLSPPDYWGEYLDNDGTGYSGTVTIYDN